MCVQILADPKLQLDSQWPNNFLSIASGLGEGRIQLVIHQMFLPVLNWFIKMHHMTEYSPAKNYRISECDLPILVLCQMKVIIFILLHSQLSL